MPLILTNEELQTILEVLENGSYEYGEQEIELKYKIRYYLEKEHATNTK